MPCGYKTTSRAKWSLFSRIINNEILKNDPPITAVIELWPTEPYVQNKLLDEVIGLLSAPVALHPNCELVTTH